MLCIEVMHMAAEQTYSVHEVAALAGITVRTLHHYEQIGLLVPKRRSNGYRAYAAADLERLQHILLYRACGMDLSAIRDALDAPAFDAREALEGHLAQLERRRRDIDAMIQTVRKTIRALEGEDTMTDEERFEGLKQATVAANEAAYGAEARARFGNAAVDAANAKLLAMDETEWNDMNELETAIIQQLRAAMATGDPSGPEAQRLASMHARWLQMHWGDGAYSPAAHRQLAQGYLADSRFMAYYDERAGEGATCFLADALEANLP